MLQRIYINNFRCFVNFTLELKPKQVIVGDNGSGKTTLFEVLSLLQRFAIDGDRAGDLFPSTIATRWFHTDDQRFVLDVQLPDGLFQYQLRLNRKPLAEPEVMEEWVTVNNKPLFVFSNEQVQLYNDQHEEGAKYPFDWHRSALATIAERSDNRKLTAFKTFLSRVLCIQIDPRAMPALAETEARALNRYGQNFAAWYRHAQAEDASATIELHEDLRKVLRGFDSIVLKSMGENRRLLSVRFVIQPQGGASRTAEFSFGELSDGQRALIVLYAVLRFAIQRGQTVCIDEPDNYLALSEIEPWLMSVLDAVDNGGGQVVIVTHHPEIIDRTALEMGIELTRNGLEPVRAMPFQQPEDSHLTPSERMARGWTGE